MYGQTIRFGNDLQQIKTTMDGNFKNEHKHIPVSPSPLFKGENKHLD